MAHTSGHAHLHRQPTTGTNNEERRQRPRLDMAHTFAHTLPRLSTIIATSLAPFRLHRLRNTTPTPGTPLQHPQRTHTTRTGHLRQRPWDTTNNIREQCHQHRRSSTKPMTEALRPLPLSKSGHAQPHRPHRCSTAHTIEVRRHRRTKCNSSIAVAQALLPTKMSSKTLSIRRPLHRRRIAWHTTQAKLRPRHRHPTMATTPRSRLRLILNTTETTSPHPLLRVQ